MIRNRLLASVAFSALMCGGALADPMAFSWNGPYVGGNLGYIGGSSTVYENNNDPDHFFDGKKTSVSSSGVLGGAQAGYNWQFGSIVLGAEADIDFASASGSGATGAPGGTFSFNTRTEISGLGTMRGRLGYAFAPVPLMVYATAGIAYGDVKNSVNLPNFPFTESGSASNWRAGWTAGGGAEYAFARNWTVRAEALYVDLGGQTVTTNSSVVGYRFGFRDTAVIGRTAINFKF